MSETRKESFLSFKNPGIIMVLIQVVVSTFVLVWFPSQTSALGYPLVAWLMFALYFLIGIQAVIYIYWVEAYEKKRTSERDGGN